MANEMGVLITVYMPTQDGEDYDPMAVQDVVDANSQAEAIAAGAMLAKKHGFDGLLAGVRLATTDAPKLLAGEEFVEGGLKALVGIHRIRQQAAPSTASL